MNDETAYYATCSNGVGYQMNENHGLYKNGARYPYCTKLKVAARYKYLSNNMVFRPNITTIAVDCNVSRWYVRKIEAELLGSANFAVVEEEHVTKSSIPGYYNLDPMDYFLIVQLYRQEPSRIAKSYCEELEMRTGKVISVRTMYDILERSFVYNATLRKLV